MKPIDKKSLKRLKTDDFLIGSVHSLTNSFELYNDGMLLYNYERLPRAYSLFQLSMEEAGKALLLLNGFYNTRIYDNNIHIRETSDVNEIYNGIGSAFYDHINKTKYILEFEMRYWTRASQQLGTGSPEIVANLKQDLQKIKELNRMKNNSLYTSIKGLKFIPPKDTFDENTVDKMRFRAFSKVMIVKNTIISKLKREVLPSEMKLDDLEKLVLES